MAFLVNSALANSKKPLKNIILDLIVTIENGDISLIKQDDTLIQINLKETIYL
ncbi:MAG: hypothetical protein ACYDG2_12385 [Ruminiclostridium sp.]